VISVTTHPTNIFPSCRIYDLLVSTVKRGTFFFFFLVHGVCYTRFASTPAKFLPNLLIGDQFFTKGV
jgi:hypothetical protein